MSKRIALNTNVTQHKCDDFVVGARGYIFLLCCTNRFLVEVHRIAAPALDRSPVEVQRVTAPADPLNSCIMPSISEVRTEVMLRVSKPCTAKDRRDQQ